MVCTLANYGEQLAGACSLSYLSEYYYSFCRTEYIWNYHFYQDGSIDFEIRLTGILSIYIAKNNESTQFGVKVAPNINAQYHQHIFSIRIDPMTDGLKNSVVETDIVTLTRSNWFCGELCWKRLLHSRHSYQNGSWKAV